MDNNQMQGGGPGRPQGPGGQKQPDNGRNKNNGKKQGGGKSILVFLVIKSYSIFYAVRQENPNIKDLHEAAINSSNSVLAASCQKQKKRSEAYGAKRYYRKGIGRL